MTVLIVILSPAPVLAQTAPGVPGSVTATRGDGYLDVSWTAPASNGGAAITGYNVNTTADGKKSWQGAASNVNPTPDNNGVYTHRVSGMDNDVNYYVAVQAVNLIGGGGWTDSAIVPMIIKPLAPGSVSVTRGNGTLAVSWTAPSNSDIAEITGYNVNTSGDGKQSWQRAASGVSGTSHTVSNVTNGSSYYVAVQAVNIGGGGDWGNSALAPALYVSNMSETSAHGSPSTVGGGWIANGFRTGSNTGGYTLFDVVAPIFPAGGKDNVTLRLFSESSGSPGTSQVTLTATGDAVDNYTFTCSGSCSLSDSATYFLVLSGASGYSYGWRATASDAETNEPSGAGWTINDSYLQSATNGTSWTQAASGDSVKFTVRYRTN